MNMITYHSSPPRLLLLLLGTADPVDQQSRQTHYQQADQGCRNDEQGRRLWLTGLAGLLLCVQLVHLSNIDVHVDRDSTVHKACDPFSFIFVDENRHGVIHWNKEGGKLLTILRFHKLIFFFHFSVMLKFTWYLVYLIFI